jgi:hypothetical protein
MRGQAALVAYLPAAVDFMDTPYNYLVLTADQDHLIDRMPAIADSLRLPDPPALPGIDSFTAAAEDATDGGKRITFRWEGSGVTRGMIVENTAGLPFPSWPVLSRGQLALNFGAPEFPDPSFTLRLWNDAGGRQVEQTLTVPWACANSYFFSPPPDRCAQQPPVTVNGAFQRFEHGRMLWLPQYGINTIHVLFDTGELQTYVDEWSSALPESDPSIIPPDGLFQPVRGFGLVWREVPTIRERLGWATAAESGTSVTYQNETRLSSPAVAYMTLPDGEIIRMTEATWATFIPGQP